MMSPEDQEYQLMTWWLVADLETSHGRTFLSNALKHLVCVPLFPFFKDSNKHFIEIKTMLLSLNELSETFKEDSHRFTAQHSKQTISVVVSHSNCLANFIP